MLRATDSYSAPIIHREILQQIVGFSADGVLLVDARDPNLSVVYANAAYEAQSGYAADELVGRPWPLLASEGGLADAGLAELRAAIGRADGCDIDVVDLRKDGGTWSCALSVRPLYTARGDLRYFLCQHRSSAPALQDSARLEVSLLQRALGQARQRIASMDQMDPVTGLMRGEHFRSLLARDLGIARRERRRLSLLAFEVVELDVYRQTFGSNAADSCLRMIAAQVAGVFRRAGDLCARCDESLLVAVAHNHTVEEAEPLAARVADKVRGLGLHNPRASSGRYVSVRSSIVAADPDSDDAAALLERGRAGLAPPGTPPHTLHVTG